MEEFILSVGEKKQIKLSWINSFEIIYCGMPSENVFSVANKESSGYQGFGYNMFYPKEMKIIKINNIEFRVLGIKPDCLKLQILKE